MATVDYAHISLNADNLPIVSGTRTKVRMIVMDHIGRGWDANEIHRQYPYLTLGQIHSALAYYYDHKVEMDGEIEGATHEADRLRAEIDQFQGPSPLDAKLKAMGRLP